MTLSRLVSDVIFVNIGHPRFSFLSNAIFGCYYSYSAISSRFCIFFITLKFPCGMAHRCSVSTNSLSEGHCLVGF